MNLEIRRRIRDNLYGSIDISIFEGEVIAHPYFQRLRRIKQTAFLNLVFPGASHTRMEHSLGVMHLAGLAWSKIKDNQLRIRNFCSRYRNFHAREMQRRQAKTVQGLLFPTFSEIESIFSSPYVLQALRLAALLHDVGHPPFSHSGERFLPHWDELIEENPSMSPYLQKYIASKAKEFKKKRVSHEILSVLVIDAILKDINFRVPNLPLKVSPQDVAAIIISEIEPEEKSLLAKNHALSLCRELISGDVDIDRMDYLRRDAKECGVAYGHFDVDRILDSLVVYSDPQDKKVHLGLQYSGLAAFEDYIRARQSMYVQLYFHKTSTACEAILQRLSSFLGDWSFPAKISSYCALDEYEIRAHLLEAGKKLLQKTEENEFRKLIDDLFVNRRLWKLVFEISEMKELTEISNLELTSVLKFLRQEHLAHELVSSQTVLTSFNTQKNRRRNVNHLRLVKIDERQFLRVESLEDFSSLTKEGGVVFHRIYVSAEDATEVKVGIREMLELTDPSEGSFA